MTWGELVALALQLPETAEARSYGEPSLKVRRGLLTRLREADGSVVLLDVPADERALLVAQSPDIYFIEPHYEPYAIVLARLDALHRDQARAFLERRWRNLASKAAVATYDAMRSQ